QQIAFAKAETLGAGCDRTEESDGEIVRRARSLSRRDRPIGRDDQGIGEGTADVDTDAVARGCRAAGFDHRTSPLLRPALRSNGPLGPSRSLVGYVDRHHTLESAGGLRAQRRAAHLSADDP